MGTTSQLVGVDVHQRGPCLDSHMGVLNFEPNSHMGVSLFRLDLPKWWLSFQGFLQNHRTGAPPKRPYDMNPGHCEVHQRDGQEAKTSAEQGSECLRWTHGHGSRSRNPSEHPNPHYTRP